MHLRRGRISFCFLSFNPPIIETRHRDFSVTKKNCRKMPFQLYTDITKHCLSNWTFHLCIYVFVDLFFFFTHSFKHLLVYLCIHSFSCLIFYTFNYLPSYSFTHCLFMHSFDYSFTYWCFIYLKYIYEPFHSFIPLFIYALKAFFYSALFIHLGIDTFIYPEYKCIHLYVYLVTN